ncbi:MAG TPA: DUF1800 domain-containing protein [Acidimicrobiales bacterium]|nr:DUF1800 domain-containing protein [Acidimicrobiales bacterium]
MGATTATAVDVARLFARVAFGATPADLDAWTGKPYADMVESLLAGAGQPIADEAQRIVFERQSLVGGEKRGDGRLQKAQGWWLERMRTTAHPLLERMTLLWHDHFATGRQDPFPDTGMLIAQNELLRSHALGSFADMVTAITIDPAMLHWLDGVSSARPLANENYARELFELFTLGKYPQTYTERDIREAARALTGWTVNNALHTVSFQAARHDAGTKTVLGSTFGDQGNTEYETVVALALAQPVAPRFIAYKLVLGLGYDPGAGDLLARPDPLVARVGDTLRRSDWDLGAAVRVLLNSDEFRYADAARGRQIVREPAELAVAACKALNVPADQVAVTNVLDAMGQRLFEPPDVSGWSNGTAWLSPATMLARYHLSVLVFQLFSQKATGVTLPASADIDGLGRLVGLAGVSANTRAALRSYLDSQAKAPEAEKQASMLVLLLTSPDWMVV